ncbi:MAG: DUF4357 domain-containing protein [bacterium]|nr:DUF4357 domain-containing protein [bacterium]
MAKMKSDLSKAKKKSKSHKHLVNMYVEKISAELFEKKNGEIIRDFIKNKRGLYALYKGNTLYYVGLASQMLTRLRHHLRDRHVGKWDGFSIYLTEDTSFLKEMETLVLKIADPPGNRIPGRFVKAGNMKKMIEDKFDEIIHKEKDRIFGKKQITIKEKSKTKHKIKRQDNKERGTSIKLSDYFTESCLIKMAYKGEIYSAKILKDGTIQYKNQIFSSPSMAAVAVKNRPTNGWTDWKYKDKTGKWVLIDTLRKKTSLSKKVKKSSNFKYNMIIVPSKKEGFERAFLVKNAWWAIKINEKHWDSIKYIAAYQSYPISAVTHWAEVERIEKYKNTGKCILYFKKKVTKLKYPLKLDDKRYTPFSSKYTTFEKFKKAKKVSELFK